MAGTACSICLDELKDPVAIPCGHLHCDKCLIRYIESCDDAMKAMCPTCRAEFPLAVPDLRVIPKKYHVYIQKAIRRVYIPQDASYTATINSLKAKVSKAERTAQALSRDKADLMDRCEAQIARANTMARREKDARDQIMFLKHELEEWKDKYATLKGKYKSLKIVKHAPPAPPASPASASRATKRKSDQAFPQAGSHVSSDASRPICPIPKRPRLVKTGDASDLDRTPEGIGYPFYGATVPEVGSAAYYASLPPTQQVFNPFGTDVVGGMAGPSGTNIDIHRPLHAHSRRLPTQVQAGSLPSTSDPHENDLRASTSDTRIQRTSTHARHLHIPESGRSVHADRTSTRAKFVAAPSAARSNGSDGGMNSVILIDEVYHPGIAGPTSSTSRRAEDGGSRTYASGSGSGSTSHARDEDMSDVDDDSFEDYFSDPFEDESYDDEPVVEKGKARERLRSYIFRGRRFVDGEDD